MQLDGLCDGCLGTCGWQHADGAAGGTHRAEQSIIIQLPLEPLLLTAAAAAAVAAAAVVACAVLAMVFANMGIFLLVAPWVSKIMGHAGGGGSSSSGDAKQPQFISAGLAEAGVYQKLLPEGGEV
jgi:hypothetical protein